jgi:tRNA(Leu) C34 or U34 (ribose-2'-O)-methylase TrmL
MYTLSHVSLESLKGVLTSFLSINSAHGINEDLVYPLMFIMHDIAYLRCKLSHHAKGYVKIYSGTNEYVKHHSETKLYVNLHVETRGYVKFHSETKKNVIFTLRSKRT